MNRYGTLLSVRFTAVANGESQLTVDNFQAGSSRGEKIPTTLSEITLIVGGDASATPAWDVNGDGTTNILDLVLISQGFGKPASLNSRNDVNGDGVINILDLNRCGRASR